jgi:hypothetical protein
MAQPVPNIQNHQEIRTLQNHNMVKFRALLGEASLHKKGTCSISLRVPSQHREIGTNKFEMDLGRLAPVSEVAGHSGLTIY